MGRGVFIGFYWVGFFFLNWAIGKVKILESEGQEINILSKASKLILIVNYVF